MRVTRFDYAVRNTAPELREVSHIELTEASNGESTFVSKTSWDEIRTSSRVPDGAAIASSERFQPAISIVSRGICKKVSRDQPWPE
jgi:hypothetical protein